MDCTFTSIFPILIVYSSTEFIVWIDAIKIGIALEITDYPTFLDKHDRERTNLINANTYQSELFVQKRNTYQLKTARIRECFFISLIKIKFGCYKNNSVLAFLPQLVL